MSEQVHGGTLERLTFWSPVQQATCPLQALVMGTETPVEALVYCNLEGIAIGNSPMTVTSRASQLPPRTPSRTEPIRPPWDDLSPWLQQEMTWPLPHWAAAWPSVVMPDSDTELLPSWPPGPWRGEARAATAKAAARIILVKDMMSESGFGLKGLE